MKIRIRMADPAGNRTVLVETPVPTADHALVASRLLAHAELRGEQVGFLVPPRCGGLARLEMMGGEFCGNAARSFGFLLCRERGLISGAFRVEISGADRPLRVRADLVRGEAWAEMPLPLGIRELEVPGRGSFPMVLLPGIRHVVLAGVDPSPVLTDEVLRAARETGDCGATGVLFLRERELTPAVYVEKTDTLYWEHSCGSGSLACGLLACRNRADGICRRSFRQSGGTISVRVRMRGGSPAACSIGGPVSLEDERMVEI